jgi:hypothetical protein
LPAELALPNLNGTAVPYGITVCAILAPDFDGYKLGVLAAGHFKEW